MITSQLSISSIQSGIGPHPTANPGSGFPLSSNTPIGSTVMSSIGYLFEWNSGVSAPTVNLIRSVPPLTGLPCPWDSNVSGGLPFLGGTSPHRSSPFRRGGHVSSGVPFLGNVNVHGSYPFLGGTYPPSNV